MHVYWTRRKRCSRRPIFRPPRNGGGSVPVAAHSLRECRGAMARRGGPLPYLGYPVTPMLAHMLPRAVGAADFSTTEKRRRECARGRAQSARVSGSDGATGRAACPTLGIRPRRCLHTCCHGRWARPVFRPPRNGGGSVPVAAHGLRECRGAMARRGRQRPFPLVWFPVCVAWRMSISRLANSWREGLPEMCRP